MVKKASSKGLLLSWLEDALNKKKFNGLRWSDESRKIFYINWTHKSSEQWSASEVQVYEAWAAFKGKLKNKNSKQLKATFRCALNSKKQLKEVHKTRTKRYWQFVDPATSRENETALKKKQHSGEEPKIQIKKKIGCLQSRTLIADNLVTSTTNNDSFGASTLDVADLITSSVTSTVDGLNFSNRFLPLDESSVYNDYGINYIPRDQNRMTPPADDSMLTNWMEGTYRYESKLTDMNSDTWQPNFMATANCIQNPTPLFYDEADSLNFSVNLFTDQNINFSTSNPLTPITENTKICDSTVSVIPTRQEDSSYFDDIQYAQFVEELSRTLSDAEMYSS